MRSAVSVTNFLSTEYPCRSASIIDQSGSATWWHAAHLRAFNQDVLSAWRYFRLRSTD